MQYFVLGMASIAVFFSGYASGYIMAVADFRKRIKEIGDKEFEKFRKDIEADIDKYLDEKITSGISERKPQ